MQMALLLHYTMSTIELRGVEDLAWHEGHVDIHLSHDDHVGPEGHVGR